MRPVPGQAPGRTQPAAGASLVSLIASLVMLAYGALAALGLVAWLRGPHVVGWRLLVTVVTVVTSVAASSALWIAPSRRTAAFGLGVLLVSLVRLGAPETWSNASYGVMAFTVACGLPLVRACFALD